MNQQQTYIMSPSFYFCDGWMTCMFIYLSITLETLVQANSYLIVRFIDRIFGLTTRELRVLTRNVQDYPHNRAKSWMTLLGAKESIRQATANANLVGYLGDSQGADYGRSIGRMMTSEAHTNTRYWEPRRTRPCVWLPMIYNRHAM